MASSDITQDSQRDPSRQMPMIRADIANEHLRAQLHKLQYELDTLRQERELSTIQHQAALRKLEQRAESDFKRAQTAEAESATLIKKREELVGSARETAAAHAAERTELERNLRILQASNAALKEQVEEAGTEVSTRARQDERVYKELESRYAALQQRGEGTELELEQRSTQLQTLQQRLSQRERVVGDLEAKILALEAQTRDVEMLGTVKRELSDQVAHLQKVEMANRQQASELRQLRQEHKSVAVVEEEKRELVVKLRMMEQLRTELAEAHLQRRILEDEKLRWTSYLDSSRDRTGSNDDSFTFKSPEDMAKAFVSERFERLSLVDRLGSLRPELAIKDEVIKTLQDEKARLASQISNMTKSAESVTNGGGAGMSDDRIRSRLERQVNLSEKQIDYLRAQIKAYEAEESEFGSPATKAAESNTVTSVAALEGLVEEYRAETKQLHDSLSKLEAAPRQPETLKRTHQDDDDHGTAERLGELRRKLRAQQDELDKLQTTKTKLDNDLQATTSQLQNLRESTRTRVLQVRNNPTAQAEATKQSTLATLREENAALLTQLLEGKTPATKVVPLSTLQSVKLQMADLEAQIAQRDKKTERLKKIWTIKFQEFTAAVESTLGWRVSFMPNGRFKVMPATYKTHVNGAGEEEENSILFDGEQATMKVSGGAHSRWEAEIRPLIEFWVDGRGQVPCFLAALQLELYDKVTSRTS